MLEVSHVGSPDSLGAPVTDIMTLTRIPLYARDHPPNRRFWNNNYNRKQNERECSVVVTMMKVSHFGSILPLSALGTNHMTLAR